MLGIITALPIEAKCFSKEIQQLDKTYQLDEQVLIRVSGIGPENAYSAAEKLIKEGVKALVSFGTAVGLSPELKPGTLCLPEKIIVQSKKDHFAAHPWWHANIIKYFHNKKFLITQESMVQSQNILHASELKRALYDEFKTVAADMESYAIASVAHQFNRPFLALRVVFDPADFNLPTFLPELIKTNGQIDRQKLLKYFLKSPQTMMQFLQLSQFYSRAKTTMKMITQSKVLQHSAPHL